ncbi:LysR family transcriptional regulator [Aeromonas salmonicida subsp. salmonicida]|uniref:LysR family transcriptional regulator n=1 Tax=Aeromonas salmonicida TaxID=645 RepID=UPI00131F5D3C|nr:LysR family transcriptional regulator [Aeromonas salmonicida]ELI6417964.1 LysR family transcriptional regulator [Aeromonas salmonicida subsp. salmonicida]ELM3646246.1 LysR family transcriptional regulator [Aeromonas salmonicida subsp. salmonicida]QHE44959.1 LysR family transcriptional regulator [Aeromonas salmonicida subsp. salmonicida]QHE46758.1 LysR family transcriptional regulator [Aeromonas salmonicida subsp. salmonicida]
MGLFATVVEQGSFTGAAEALGMPKSSVSQKISRLETQLGVRLLQRTTRRLNLTPQGEIYVEQCQALLALARSANLAMARLRAAPAGRVRITAPEATGTLLLGRILAEFRALYPEVVLELTLCDDQLDLVGEGYDLALWAAPLKDSSLICRRIGQVPRHLVAALGYLAAHGAPQQLSELGLHPCLVHSALPVWPLQEGGWRPQGACISNSLLALRELALHEGGIALLPHHVCQEDLATGRLQKLLPDHPIPPNPFYLIYPSREHLAPALRSLMDFVAERLPFA